MGEQGHAHLDAIARRVVPGGEIADRGEKRMGGGRRRKRHVGDEGGGRVGPARGAEGADGSDGIGRCADDGVGREIVPGGRVIAEHVGSEDDTGRPCEPPLGEASALSGLGHMHETMAEQDREVVVDLLPGETDAGADLARRSRLVEFTEDRPTEWGQGRVRGGRIGDDLRNGGGCLGGHGGTVSIDKTICQIGERRHGAGCGAAMVDSAFEGWLHCDVQGSQPERRGRAVGVWRCVLLVAAIAVSGCTRTDSGDTTTTSAGDPAPETTQTEASTTSAPLASTTTTQAEAVEIVAWADGPRAGALEGAAERFEEETGVAVSIEIIEFGDIRTQVIDVGADGDGPDVFVGAHVWTAALVDEGLITPVDLGATRTQTAAVAIEAFLYDGAEYALPYSMESVALYVNDALVESAPVEWDELVAICGELTDIENCVGIPGGGSQPDAYHNYLFVSALGGYIFGTVDGVGADSSDVGFTTEGAVEGVAFLADQVAAGIVGSVDSDRARTLFLDGAQPFLVTGPWERGRVADSGISWSVAPLPVIEGSSPAPLVSVQGFFVGAHSEHPTIAQTFLADFVGDVETMTALHDADPRSPTQLQVVEALGDDPVTAAFTQSARAGVPIPNLVEMAAVWGPFGENLLAVRNGELGAQDAMENTERAVLDALGR